MAMLYFDSSGVGVHCAVATLRRPAGKGGVDGWGHYGSTPCVCSRRHGCKTRGERYQPPAVCCSVDPSTVLCVHWAVSAWRRPSARGGVYRVGHVRSSPRVCPRRHDCRTRGRRPAITFLDVSQPYIGATCPMGRVGVSAPSRKRGGGWMGSLPVHTLRLQPAPRL